MVGASSGGASCSRCGGSSLEVWIDVEVEADRVTTTDVRACTSCGYRRTFITIGLGAA